MRYIIYSDRYLPMLDITQIGYAKDPKVTHFGPAIHGYYIIHYVISGKGTINSNTVKKGQGFLIRPGKTDVYESDSDEPWEFLWVIVDDVVMDSVFDFYDADIKTSVFNYDCIDEVRKTAEYIIENNGKTFRSSEVLEMYLKIFNQHTKNNTLKTISNADMYINLAKNYIELNIYNGVSVKDVIDYLGVSQPYLFKIFKSGTGISPKQCIDEYKLKLAQKMLKDTTLSVSRIAESLGYFDVQGFSKFFSKKKGISPSDYRARTKSGGSHV